MSVSGNPDEVHGGNWRGRDWVSCAGLVRHWEGREEVYFPSISSLLGASPRESEEPQTWGSWKGPERPGQTAHTPPHELVVLRGSVHVSV